MTGGLLQLVAVGAQDVYLISNPQITFFKTVYRRYTNFSMEMVEKTLNQKIDFGKNINITIPRNGDMINKIYLQIVLPEIILSKGSKFAWTRFIGFALINFINIEIGGQLIDKQFNEWLFIWLALSRKDKKDRGTAKILGNVPELITYNNKNKPRYILYIALPAFSKAIPLIALQYHELTLKFNISKATDMIVYNDTFIKKDIKKVFIESGKLLINYIYLDTDERKQMAQMGHEYLIQPTQINFFSANSKINGYGLNFNHPVKEIAWATKNANYTTGKKFLFYTNRFWQKQIPVASEKILRESILLTNTPNSFIFTDQFFPGTRGKTNNGQITIINDSTTNTLLINTDSLLVKDKVLQKNKYNLIDKIEAIIMVGKEDEIFVNINSTNITVRDLSIPVKRFIDTRYNADDPHVNIFGSYGILIDRTVNPVQRAQLLFNGVEVFDRRGKYFNYVQPDKYHRNTPPDGINIYSFALDPENIDPTGTANFSRLDKVQLNIWFDDPTYKKGLPKLDFINKENIFFSIARNYNILRFMSGMAGQAFAN